MFAGICHGVPMYVVMPRFCRGCSNLLPDFVVEFVGRDPQRRTNLLRGGTRQSGQLRERFGWGRVFFFFGDVEH